LFFFIFFAVVLLHRGVLMALKALQINFTKCWPLHWPAHSTWFTLHQLQTLRWKCSYC